MPKIRRITVFPIKSLDGHLVTEATVLPSGALVGDRRYALQDDSGKFVNGKRFPAIHNIRACYADDFQAVTLRCGDSQETYALEPDNHSIAAWCSNVLGTACRLVFDLENGFPDDSEAPGPTLISTATLAEVASWFDELDLEEARRRFRMNLEIDAELPFWEDRLVGQQNSTQQFRIGSTVWLGYGVCQRCVVPSRDSRKGTATRDFEKTFSQLRQQMLPDWSPAESFDHFYRLGINTALSSIVDSNILRVGDSVKTLHEG